MVLASHLWAIKDFFVAVLVSVRDLSEVGVKKSPGGGG